jgi:LmbE family N-acetylglucosaminyl deacetylase
MENKTILVVAAHPDDEVLGCGGTMARYSRAGHKVLTLILAEGLTSRRGEYDRNHQAPEMLKLVEAAQRANDILGVSSLTLKGFPDNRMDSLDRLEVIREVERFIQATQPEIVYTHHQLPSCAFSRFLPVRNGRYPHGSLPLYRTILWK